MNKHTDVLLSKTVDIKVPEIFLRVSQYPEEVYEDFHRASGYRFPWGFVVEMAEGDSTSWDFYPTSLYQLCPNIGFWTDWFAAKLDGNSCPYLNSDLDEVTDGFGTFSAFGIWAWDEHVKSVRSWLAHLFLPTVVPALLQEGEVVGNAWRAKDIRFYYYALDAIITTAGADLDRVALEALKTRMAERYGENLCF